MGKVKRKLFGTKATQSKVEQNKITKGKTLTQDSSKNAQNMTL